MKRKRGYFCQGLCSIEKNTPQAGTGLGQTQGSGNGNHLGSPTTPGFQASWWETGWFKEWERVARRET
jgi:hypothetical protein